MFSSKYMHLESTATQSKLPRLKENSPVITGSWRIDPPATTAHIRLPPWESLDNAKLAVKMIFKISNIQAEPSKLTMVVQGSKPIT
jgi:hypothetical protein